MLGMYGRKKLFWNSVYFYIKFYKLNFIKIEKIVKNYKTTDLNIEI